MEIKEKGIDISHWNIVDSFEKVKESGIGFVIIKAGGSDKGFYTDKCFEKYYQRAKDAGLKVGAYYYVGKMFWGGKSGDLDALRFREMIKGKTFDYPVCLDVENMDRKFQHEITEASIAFCDMLEDFGYYVSIYGSDISTFKELLDIKKLGAYDKWVARYSSNPPSYVSDYGIWQYSSKGSVPGIRGNVDLDYSFKDYKSIMEKHGLNRG